MEKNESNKILDETKLKDKSTELPSGKMPEVVKVHLDIGLNLLAAIRAVSAGNKGYNHDCCIGDEKDIGESLKDAFGIDFAKLAAAALVNKGAVRIMFEHPKTDKILFEMEDLEDVVEDE